jgi:hypothetical protein
MHRAVFADDELEEALGQLARAGHTVRARRERKDWGRELRRAEERERLAREAVARIRRQRIISGEAADLPPLATSVWACW